MQILWRRLILQVSLQLFHVLGAIVQMTTNLTASPYRPIEYEGEIKLLTIDPDRASDLVSCNQGHAFFRDPERPGYDALSYTWGSQDIPLAISCNGQALKVGKNLFATSRHLRRESEDLSGLTLSVSINATIKRKRNRCSSCGRSTRTQGNYASG
jgi:hypothetical protein